MSDGSDGFSADDDWVELTFRAMRSVAAVVTEHGGVHDDPDTPHHRAIVQLSVVAVAMLNSVLKPDRDDAYEYTVEARKLLRDFIDEL